MQIINLINYVCQEIILKIVENKDLYDNLKKNSEEKGPKIFSYTEIAKKVYVSSGTVHVRMRKLEDMGIVKSATLNIDFSKLGYDISAFLGIYLEKSSMYDNVAQALKNIPQVVRVNYTTGNYSMFVEIVCKDMQQLRFVLHDELQNIKGIERTETLISLEESFSRNVKIV